MKWRDCPECNGTGEAEYEVPVVDHVHGGFLDTEIRECSNCGGSGEVEFDEDDLLDNEIEDDGFVTVHPKLEVRR